jgi:hypothetical protein
LEGKAEEKLALKEDISLPSTSCSTPSKEDRFDVELCSGHFAA